MAKLPTEADIRRTTPALSKPIARLDGTAVVRGMRAQAGGLQRFGQGAQAAAAASEAINLAEEKRVLNDFERRGLKVAWEQEQNLEELKRTTPMAEMQGFEDRIAKSFKGSWDVIHDDAPEWVKPRLEEMGLKAMRRQVNSATTYATEARASYAIAEAKIRADTSVYAEAMSANSATEVDAIAAKFNAILAANPDIPAARKAEAQLYIEAQAARGFLTSLSPDNQIEFAENILAERADGSFSESKAGRIFRSIDSEELQEIITAAKGDLADAKAFGVVDMAQEQEGLTWGQRADLIDGAVRDGVINAEEGKLAQSILKRRRERAEAEEDENQRQEKEYIYDQIAKLHEEGKYEEAASIARRATFAKNREDLLKFALEGPPVVGNAQLYSDLNSKILLGTPEELLAIDLKRHASSLTPKMVTDLQSKLDREMQQLAPSGSPDDVRPNTSTFNSYIESLGITDNKVINKIAAHANDALDRAWRDKGEALDPAERDEVLRRVFKGTKRDLSWFNVWSDEEVNIDDAIKHGEAVDKLREKPLGTTRSEAMARLRRLAKPGTVITPAQLREAIGVLEEAHSGS